MATAPARSRQPIDALTVEKHPANDLPVFDPGTLVAVINDSLTAQLFKLTGSAALTPSVRDAVLRDVARNIAQAVLGAAEEPKVTATAVREALSTWRPADGDEGAQP